MLVWRLDDAPNGMGRVGSAAATLGMFAVLKGAVEGMLAVVRGVHQTGSSRCAWRKCASRGAAHAC